MKPVRKLHFAMQSASEDDPNAVDVFTLDLPLAQGLLTMSERRGVSVRLIVQRAIQRELRRDEKTSKQLTNEFALLKRFLSDIMTAVQAMPHPMIPAHIEDETLDLVDHIARDVAILAEQ